jgi:uncharacterized membrane protein
MIPRTHLIIIMLMLLATLGVSAWFYPQLGQRVPVHWNIRGEIDGYGSKWVPLLITPGAIVLVVLIMSGLPLLGPFRRNFELFRTIYGRLCVTIVTAFSSLHVIVLLGAAGHGLRIGADICIVLGVMSAVLGNWLGKVRRNFYIGIRTPWTLASDAVWERTHRFGGRLFVICGLADIAAGLLAPVDWICFVVLLGGIAVTVVACVLHSLYWYRRLGKVDDLSAGQ